LKKKCCCRKFGWQLHNILLYYIHRE
jgi:hypothetical protein